MSKLYLAKLWKNWKNSIQHRTRHKLLRPTYICKVYNTFKALSRTQKEFPTASMLCAFTITRIKLDKGDSLYSSLEKKKEEVSCSRRGRGSGV